MNNLLSDQDTKAVFEILTRELGVDQTQLTSEARLKEDLAADSLTLVQISMALEERFSLSISDQQLETVQTVCDVFELLADLLQPPRRCS